MNIDEINPGACLAMIDDKSIGYVVGKYSKWGKIVWIILFVNKTTQTLGIAETRALWAWFNNVITHAK